MSLVMRKNFEAAVLFAFICLATSMALAQGANIPVTSLKNFTSVEQWQLDITWRAKDSFEDDSWKAQVEMTGTARFILKQRNKSATAGYWGVESVQSANLSYTGSSTYKSRNEHVDYKAKGGPVMMGAASLVVGAATPGYELGVTIAFPITFTDIHGTHDSLLAGRQPLCWWLRSPVYGSAALIGRQYPRFDGGAV